MTTDLHTAARAAVAAFYGDPGERATMDEAMARLRDDLAATPHPSPSAAEQAAAGVQGEAVEDAFFRGVQEGVRMAEESAAAELRMKTPPCIECGAMTEAEASSKCHCSGDKDDCHGCRLWPDPAPAVERGVAEEREAFEAALKQTWKMVDPLKPCGQPGSYARGEYNGICAALTTMRENFARALSTAGKEQA